MSKNLTIGDEIMLKYIVIYKILTRHKISFLLFYVAKMLTSRKNMTIAFGDIICVKIYRHE